MKIVSLTLFLLLSALSLCSQKIHTTLRQSWHQDAWRDSLLDTYTYDSRGLLSVKIRQQWDVATSTWMNILKEIHTYNPDSTEQQQLTQTWDADAWQNQKMLTLTHLPNGGTSQLYQIWLDGSWQNEMKIAYVNDKKGRTTKSLKQKWDPAAGGWVNDIVADYSCRRDGKMTSYTALSWDAKAQNWSAKRRDQCIFSYDKSGRLLGNTNKTLIDDRLEHSSRSIISYDPEGHKVSNSVTDRDESEKEWHELLREDYTNNSDGSVSSCTCQLWHRWGGEPYKKVMTKYSYF